MSINYTYSFILFAYTKLLKDYVQYLLRTDVARYFAQLLDCHANLLSGQHHVVSLVVVNHCAISLQVTQAFDQMCTVSRLTDAGIFSGRIAASATQVVDK